MTVALSQKSAVAIANQTWHNMGAKFPWSFVAVPASGDHRLKLRVIQVEEEEETFIELSHARPVHGFANACQNAIADMMRILRQRISAKLHLRAVS